MEPISGTTHRPETESRPQAERTGAVRDRALARAAERESALESRREKRAEVEISAEARTRNATANTPAPGAGPEAGRLNAGNLRAPEKSPLGAGTPAAAQKDESANPTSNRLIAARVGPAPVDTLKSITAEQVLQDSLKERARLRSVGTVLEQPEKREAQTVELLGSGERRGPEVELMGAGDDVDSFQVPIGLGAASDQDTARPAASLDHRSPQNEGRDVPLDLDRQKTVREQQREPMGLLAEEESSRQTQVAPQIGLIQNTDEARIDLLGDKSLELGEAIAHDTFTNGGLVEAKSADDLATRFLAGVPETDPGPEPRFPEPIGNKA